MTLTGAIDSATFLIPILTPRFFASAECRREVDLFRARERRLGRADLILPIYYITSPLLDVPSPAQADLLAEFFRSRQYVDWRALRHQSPTSVRGRKALATLSERLPAAIAKGELPATAPTSVSPLAPATPDDAQLLAAAVDPDPLIAGEAARFLGERPDLIRKLVGQSARTPVAKAAVRSVVSRYPELSATVLMERLAQAGPAGAGWHIAAPSVDYFVPAHAPFCERELVRMTKAGHIDLNRLAVEALGRCGNSGWGYGLRELLVSNNSYELEKLGPYVIEALARFFVRSANEPGTVILSTSHVLRDELVHLSAERPISIHYLALRKILQGCDGRHTDSPITEWLASDSSEVVGHATNVLGNLQIVRAVRPLLRVLEGGDNAGALYDASCALGSTATPEAIERLLAAPPGSDAASGLFFALEHIDEPVRFREATTRLLTTESVLRHLVVRAIGRRRAVEFTQTLQSEAEGTEPVDRGVALLALARLGIEIDRLRLRRSLAQAANNIERIFTALAILVVDPAAYPKLEGQLRNDLGENSFELWPHLQVDILEVLRGTRHPDAQKLADAWKPFYPLAIREPSLLTV